MKLIRWNEAKNELLRRERDVSFEEVLIAIGHGNLLDILEHHDKTTYQDQKIFIVNIGQYAYMVPFVETIDELFLKTIIPSRKATKKYLVDTQPKLTSKIKPKKK